MLWCLWVQLSLRNLVEMMSERGLWMTAPTGITPGSGRKSLEHLRASRGCAYLLYLTNDRRLAASSIIVTVSALRFFYTATLKHIELWVASLPALKFSAGVIAILGRGATKARAQRGS